MLLRLSRTITILWASMWERSEEHTSELQSWLHLVCRLLLEKKKCARSESLEPHQLRCETVADNQHRVHLPGGSRHAIHPHVLLEHIAAVEREERFHRVRILV